MMQKQNKKRWSAPRVEALKLEPEAGLCATSVMQNTDIQALGQETTTAVDFSGSDFNHIWE